MTSDLIWTRSDVIPTETSQKQQHAWKRWEKNPRQPETNHWPGRLTHPVCMQLAGIIHIGFSCSHASTLPNSAIRFQVAVSMHSLWPLHTCTFSFMIRRVWCEWWLLVSMTLCRKAELGFFCQLKHQIEDCSIFKVHASRLKNCYVQVQLRKYYKLWLNFLLNSIICRARSCVRAGKASPTIFMHG